MKRIIFIILFTLAATILHAQSANFKWAKQMGGRGADAAGASIAVDADGNVYTTGGFSGTADFDPGPGTYNLTSAGTYDMFIFKLDSSGNFIWAKQMGGNSSLDHVSVSSITLDAAGNIYSTGTFQGTVDFDPAPGVFTLSAIGNFRTSASFVLKLDADGNFIWAKQTGGETEGGGGRSIVTDAAGNVYTSGVFQWVQDFDPGPAIFNLDGGSDRDIYITKFDADGNFIWAKAPEPYHALSYVIEGGYIALDAAGNIDCTGDFSGTADFDPGAGVFTLDSVWVCGDRDIFVWKLTNDGNFVWVKQIGGRGFDQGFGIAVDQSGNVYTSGFFSYTVDFDPGPGIYNLTTTSDWNAPVSNHLFLSKLNTNGDFVWAKMDYYGASFLYDPSVFSTAENIYTTGGFQNTVDFDPGPGIYNLTSFGDDDIFVRKVGKCTGSTSNSLTVTTCKGYTLNGYTYTYSGIYTQTITNSGGCDSIITLNLTIDNTINADYADEYVSTCSAYTWHCRTYENNCSGTTQCLTFNSSGVYKDTVITPNTCDSIITLHLTITPPLFSTITESICNGQNYNGHSSSGTYIDTLVATNGCDSIRTLQLTVLSKSFSTIAETICDGQTYDGHGSSGTYYIDTLVATNGCDSITTLQLTVLPKPAPYLGADTALCTGESIQLYPGQFTTYTWQDGSAQNHFTVTQPGLYSVIVSNSCGSGSDEILIKEGICDSYFPSAFTPNNDGKNDLFKILGAQNLKDYHLAVYNRYGQKVFETNDYRKGWTGDVKGQLQNSGVYVWYCNFKKSSSPENIVMKGTVALIR
jgi:gliding motility-associated-like protein